MAGPARSKQKRFIWHQSGSLKLPETGETAVVGTNSFETIVCCSETNVEAKVYSRMQIKLGTCGREKFVFQGKRNGN